MGENSAFSACFCHICMCVTVEIFVDVSRNVLTKKLDMDYEINYTAGVLLNPEVGVLT